MSYYKTKESVTEYIKLAKDVNGRALINRLKEFLPTVSLVLEIGSGPGTDFKLLKQDYRVIGSDNSKEFLQHLKETNPKDEFIELDAETLECQLHFDSIYSNKVLHHLNDKQLTNSIKRQYHILNTGGIICHSFWLGKGSEVFKGLFVNYHSKPDLRNFFESKFEILLLETYKEFDENDSIILIGRKK